MDDQLPSSIEEAPNAGPGVNGAPPVDNCVKCGAPLPEGHHPMRRYCDDHLPKKKKKPGATDRVPPSIKVDMRPPATKRGSDLEKYEEAALRLLGFMPLGFAMAGDEVCAKAIGDAVPAIAHQLALLAEYHPGLAKLLAPSSTTGEAMVWLGLVMAVMPPITAILVHHKVLPPKMAEMLGASFLGAQVSQDNVAAA